MKRLILALPLIALFGCASLGSFVGKPANDCAVAKEALITANKSAATLAGAGKLTVEQLTQIRDQLLAAHFVLAQVCP
jgi:hypothetical protein